MWIVGMMGSGKSTVGRELARRLGIAFEDTDETVVATSGRSIADIFASDGEPAFRELERAAIEALAGRSCVAALGGGAMAQPGVAERLRQSGPVFYLMASPEALSARVVEEGGRPLLEGLDERDRIERLRALSAERVASYERAHHHIPTDGLSAAEVADEVIARLRVAS